MLATSALHASVVLGHDLLIQRDAEVKLNNEWLTSFPTGKDAGNLIKLGNGIVNEFTELVEGTISHVRCNLEGWGEYFRRVYLPQFSRPIEHALVS
jgi:hypothetical protein